MSFLWASMLWLLLLVPILILVYVALQRRRQKFALRYASLSLVKDALGRGPGIRRHIPAMVFLLGIIVALVALARPVATVLLPSQQGTVILAMDVSRSMSATDVSPTRLDAAKAAAVAFVDKQPKGVNIGIVSFSNNASLVQAPTANRDEALSAIDRLSVQSATAIGQGILASLNAIAEQTGQPPVDTNPDQLGQGAATPSTIVPAGSSDTAAIILLSDGQNNVAPAPLDIISEAIDRGIRVYTVGLGTTGGTVLGFRGRSVRVFLDEATLKQIAQDTGAHYYRAENAADLRDIYSNLGTQLVFKRQETELTAWFTGAAVVLVLAAVTISLLWFNRLP
jgi:Ca-activated chloride channel family protein